MISGKLIDHGKHLQQMLSGVVVPMWLVVTHDQVLPEFPLPWQGRIPACQQLSVMIISGHRVLHDPASDRLGSATGSALRDFGPMVAAIMLNQVRCPAGARSVPRLDARSPRR